MTEIWLFKWEGEPYFRARICTPLTAEFALHDFRCHGIFGEFVAIWQENLGICPKLDHTWQMFPTVTGFAGWLTFFLNHLFVKS